ncbi:MAG: RNA methyltransferase [Syntrophobacterales bacterium]|nr:RNA methyltransferase [Syntrophobacterales bacterium]
MKKETFSPRIVRIQSRRNDTFRHFESLLRARGIKRAGKTLVFGERLVKELILNMPEVVEAIIGYTGFIESSKGRDLLQSVSSWYLLESSLFATLDIFNTGFPCALCKVPPMLPWDFSKGLPGSGCSLLIPLQDPENVGSAIRSAVAFGVKQVIILREGAHPFHPKAIRTSAGAVFKIKFFAGPSINELPSSLPIVPLDAKGKDINHFSFPESFGLLPGLEGPGLPPEWRDRAVRIPTTGKVESLNSSVALSIALYRWFSRSIPPGV